MHDPGCMRFYLLTTVQIGYLAAKALMSRRVWMDTRCKVERNLSELGKGRFGSVKREAQCV